MVVVAFVLTSDMQACTLSNQNAKQEAGELQQQQQEKALEKEEEGVADKGKSNAAAGSGRRRGTEGAAGEEEQGLEEAWLRAVLRHNAHGPEFKGYAQVRFIVLCWGSRSCSMRVV